VDALTDWGVSLLVAGKWAAWHLSSGWKLGDRDIGWAESIALELAVMWLIQMISSNCEVTIHGDNMGVIGAFSKVRSHNVSCNATIWHIGSSLVPHDDTVLPVYVPLVMNRADPLSCSILGHPDSHLECGFELPDELTKFLFHV